ncbi:Trypsin-like peptidase domain-containing protein [Paracoccus isoporae]|uniref:Trypsin-like peptidase domain-containing protein n=1 Tax=Paracoccus isoporae TaxID=591205 RepID=A0A1G7BV21_9RHOB|nr:serine protease [Paracoccus isoporae]SDE30847.1 Trypsin-like peptidase domain-containing protein [Paracoccus isoporae]
MRRGLAALALVALTGLPAAAQTLAQRPSPKIVQDALTQVGQVIASDCPDSSSRTGTAFVWPDAESAVTARHVVAGCGSIRVQFPNGPVLAARADRKLAERDLLILRLTDSSGRDPVRLSAALPVPHTQVAVVGYALGAPTPDDKLLTLSAANDADGAQLRDMLPSGIRQEIERSGPWSLDTAILRLDGNMVSGHSGAPLFAPDGSVAAIGAGGLQDGASGIVWAVQARYLLDNAAWQTIPDRQLPDPASAYSFSYQAPQQDVPTVACGDFSLKRQSIASLAELRQSTDDPAGLEKILFAVMPDPAMADAFRFDVWVDLQSGATIPVPSGAELMPGPVGCWAVVSPSISMNIVTRHLPSLPENQRQWEIQSFSQNFEASFAVQFPQGLPVDPMFTYMAPIGRPDGFMVNRKGFGTPQWVGPDVVAMNYVFLSHVLRGPDYAGVSAVRTTVVAAEAAQNCQFGVVEACRSLDPNSDWARAALAVHLTTMPPI